MAVSVEGRPAGVAAQSGVRFETDPQGVERLRLSDDGWDFWQWQGHKIHYIKSGSSGPPLILIHGFGASAYHWRYNIPVLARTHQVYALDLLGFGWSDKPLVDYGPYAIWADQIASFINEVVGGQPAVIVGNSLGGYNCLATAAKYPELIRGVVLVNAAGRFEDVKATVEAPLEAALTMAEKGAKAALGGSKEELLSVGTMPAEEKSMMQRMTEPVAQMARRAAVYMAFLAAKQPSRIKQVLQQVYTNDTNVDDELVRSIVRPAQDPKAAEVFFRIITGNGIAVNRLLQQVKAPLLLLWGEQDPWIRPAAADRIASLYPSAERVRIPAGHCPHDELPQPCNEALLKWLAKLPVQDA
ncbi:hypothetical protein WJX72_010275 [[Myrmecia] bisecta]|uniref:AB hydrolase-1 domain-containing protein n=1 Tax=[Myrmecia] bisecta TaxID=41462 RepID=A0AAW1R9C9_9CHLO